MRERQVRNVTDLWFAVRSCCRQPRVAMSRRKQAKPRSLKRDEEWDDGNEQNVLAVTEQDNETTGIKQDDEEEEEEEEELQRAFSRHSDEYLQVERSSPVQGPDLENQNSLDSEALGTGSSSWQSEDGGGVSRRGGETPSSCATPTSASFPSEPEVDPDTGNNAIAPYPCQFCDRTFPRLSYLKKHEQSHGDQMPYRCSWCARLFKHKRSRDRHVKLHTGDRRYRCTHCEAAFSRSDHLKIHMKTHDTQKPYQCTACSRGYNTAAALTSHMQSHKKQHQSQGAKLQDIDYGRRSVSSHSTSSPPVPTSPSPSSLNLTTSLNSKTLKSSQGSSSTTPILTSPLKLACMYCTRDSFSCMQQLQMHVHTMHQAILSGEAVAMSDSQNGNAEREKRMDEASSAASDYQKKHREDSENAFTCNQCTMKFSSLNLLRDHLMSIHRTDGFGAGLMLCPLCGIPCASAAAYAEHYVLQHCENRRLAPLEPREYAAYKPNGTYDSKRNQKSREQSNCEPADLTSKRSLDNNSDNNYTAGTLLCGQCGAALKDFESFREHLARHLQADHRSEVVRHPCPKCDASFQEREGMLAHLTKHYLSQISKEYGCGACKKLYPHPDLLQRHLLDSHAHHLYRCALCRDTFDSRVAIQVHFAVKHSQECRIYRCNACTTSNNENSPGNAPGEGKSFFRSESEMANHVRNVHAPPPTAVNSPAARSPASTPGLTGNATSARCVFCGVCCNSELELQLHLASHSANMYRCPVCREGFAVEFLLDRHIAQAHHQTEDQPRTNSRENGRIGRPPRLQDETKSQKRGRSPASSNNNSLNQRDNNNKRANYANYANYTSYANYANPSSSPQQQQQQCDLCERGEFSNEAELQAHKKVAHPATNKLQSKSVANLSMTCAYCGEACRSRAELESHTRIQHASNEPGGRHKCNICDEVCPSGAILAEHKLQKHCKIQLSDTCIVCRGSLTTESQFLEHVQRHSLENVDPQQRLDNGSLPAAHLPAACVVCRQTLISDLECRLHARHHLRVSTGSNSAGSGASPSPSPNRKSQSPSCCLCLRDCSTDEFVNLPPSHVSGGSQTLRVCKPCYIRHSQGLPILNSPYEPVRSKCERPWLKDGQWDSSKDRWETEGRFKEGRSEDGKRCHDCGLKFEDPEEMEKHRLEHDKPVPSNARTYTCIQCQISFPTEAKIQQHVRKEHLEGSGNAVIEALRCHLCLFEASSPLQLQSHLIEHTFAGCAALSCYICQSLFTAPIGLQNHMLQEHGLGARPYDCSKCTLKFFFRAELDHHMLTFHRPSSPGTTPENGMDQKSNDRKEGNGESEVKVKEEVMPETVEEDEEEINVDEQVEQGNESDGRTQIGNNLKTETEGETVPQKVES
ncbi:zinc finger protein 423 homolog isoform X2 [Ceratina calcarata]|uniref:Zinc finger protein 423 homolog isoform X2 n=1 Tax=Ceratina calcarata TaxID=156304 RepID=A0AAJ7J4W8_9HYME|nr:zinc finger protein 423 homolog isoform X2 [Ceratina calcarata]